MKRRETLQCSLQELKEGDSRRRRRRFLERAFQPGSSIPATAQRGHFLLDKVDASFKTTRDIINNKSGLGIRVERSLPELSSPFEMSSARVKQPGNSNKESLYMKIRPLVHILFPIVYLVLLSTAQAVVPLPDG